MLIDWFTVAAQVVNFLILVWLLKRFLYRPILDAIDAREKLIAAQLAGAQEKEAQAGKERTEFQHKNEALDQQRESLLNEATEAANAERQRLLEEARMAAKALGAKREKALQDDTRNLHEAIAHRTRDEVFAIARKALGDLASVDLEERVAEVFVRRVREMDEKSKADLAAALATDSASTVIRSAFDLPEAQRATIQTALDETFDTHVALRFETAPDLIGGIELTTDGHKIAWSIDDYLAQLGSDVAELTKGRDMAPDGSEASADEA